MKFTLSWLRQHLDTDAPIDAISERLTMLGLEVESIEDPAALLADFTVAQVVEAVQHPDADRLRVCTVDPGCGATLQVVCGAPNARAGIKVILARPGARIPANGEVLKKGKIRGVESQGMLCSWRELGLGEDHDGIAELDPAATVGGKLVEAMAFDPVFDVSITPNRADCLGVRGIARDLAASGMGTLKPLKAQPVVARLASPITVSLDFPHEAADACPLFAGRYIRGVSNCESPDWLKRRLTAIGLRPISALVDITNLFTYDLGRPLHVFDAAKVTGNIRARLAKPGERLLALNGREYELDETMTVIADEAGPEALAGIIGGAHSGCGEDTTDVFLESALFDPVRTAATGRRLGIDSDARYRFERGVDPVSAVSGMEMATRMILELCGGEASEPVIAGAEPNWHRSITLRPERVAGLGGIEIGRDGIERILNALGCIVAPAERGTLLVHPPSWRADLTAEHDIVEEVIRVNGYDRIPTTPLPRPSMPRTVLTPEQRRVIAVRRALAARGMVETVTWSFTASAAAAQFGGVAEGLVLSNPISADLDAMRPSLLPNLVAAAGRNADRGLRDVTLFELGPQFEGAEPGRQRLVAAGLR
ncbi:MAG: phenylalanine--tRNA ligase subunit beta, partial [Alphaproteobacteria bacterium]|nr:phenylalanine--tRNA ligase subunit beta [Alphaproteobacteria bacterium]